MSKFRLWYQNELGRGIIVVEATTPGEAINSLKNTTVTRCKQIPDECSASFTVPSQAPDTQAPALEPDPRQMNLFPAQRPKPALLSREEAAAIRKQSMGRQVTKCQ